MSETVNSRDAAFMLDTDIDQDMKAYKEEITLVAIKHINRTPSLYNYIKGNKEYKMSIKDSATTWAHNHNEEFGDLFITELESVDWDKVSRTI